MTGLRTGVGWLATGLLLGACVVGYRGKAAFSGEHEIGGVEEVRITMPDTPIDIVTCTAVAEDPTLCPETLSYRGIWHSIAGTASHAEDTAATPTLQLTRDQGFATLEALVPLSVAGLVDLEMGTIRLPDDRDLQIVGGVGDVFIDGPRASVTVDIEVGDVEILGGDAGVAVRTDLGDVVLLTAGHADIRTRRGRVDVEQTGGVTDLLVQTGEGDITVTIQNDADVEFSIRTPGRIVVNTPQVTTVARGSFERRVGTGAVRITLSTDRGDVVVRGP